MLKERTLLDELMAIHATAERIEGRGAILSGPRGYLSGIPYLISSDITRAFVFKNRAQAELVREKYMDELEQFVAVARA